MEAKKIVGLLIILLMMTLGVVYLSNQQDDGERVVIEVTTEQFKFTPNIINVTYGSDVTLRITSLDVTHGFQVDEYKIYNVVVPAGETVDVNFRATIRGEFYFYCTVLCGTGHANHLGTLVVT
jgi:cytochrome c oxidase subunit 2